MSQETCTCGSDTTYRPIPPVEPGPEVEWETCGCGYWVRLTVPNPADDGGTVTVFFTHRRLCQVLAKDGTFRAV